MAPSTGSIRAAPPLSRRSKRSRTTSWKDFIAAHMNVLAAADFFTVEVLTRRGLVTYYVLFFIHLETRRVMWRGSPDIRIKSGCNRSPVARRGRPGDIWMDAGMFSMIATRSSAHHFGLCWRQVA